jgi:hypothetical protein
VRFGALGAAGLLLALVLPVALGSCGTDSGTGYIEIKAVPPSPLLPLYLDAVKLEPLRNGSALLRHKVGMTKLQTEGEGGYLAVLCTIDVKKNRITSITISALSRPPRCQCARTGGADATGSRTCIG